MLIENTRMINDFDITINNQYFKILAIQISYNNIIIIQKEAGVIIKDENGEILNKTPYSTYDWSHDFSVMNKFENDIIYRSIGDYLQINENKKYLCSEIHKSFPFCCQTMFFHYIDNHTGESIKLGYYRKYKDEFCYYEEEK